MAKAAPISSDEIDLAGKNLHNLSALKKVDRSKCKVLNLHNNMLNDLTDLPRFLFLTELNISSNRFKYIPDLSFLPALTVLDASGNMIESVLSLSFLPGLKVLKLAYNCIRSLHGINGANVPNLELLDIRENPIAASEHEIQPISTLKHLTEVSIATSNLQIIALLFKTCPPLEFVDRKSQAIWREIALSKKQPSKAAPPVRPAPPAAVAATQAAVEPVPTPHFDKVAAKFKQHMLTASPSSADTYSASRQPTQTPVGAVKGVASPGYSSRTSQRSTAPAYHHHQRSPEPMASPDISLVDESAQVSAAYGVDESEHQRLLRLQGVVTAAAERAQAAAQRCTLRAFYRIQLYGQRTAHAAAVQRLQQSHADELTQLRTEHTWAAQLLTEQHDRQAATLRQEQEQSSLRCTQLESQLATARVELEAERDKGNVLRLSLEDLRHTYTTRQERDERTIQDLELALQTARAGEQRLQEKQDLTLRELESALSESTATIEKLRLELTLTKEQTTTADSKVAALQTSLGALQYEKSELYAKFLTLEKQVSNEKGEFSMQLAAAREQIATLSTDLGVKTKECDHWRQEHGNATRHTEKVETRLRQLHGVFESLKETHSKLEGEHAALKESDAKKTAALQSMATNLQNMNKLLDMRNQNCAKCTDYAKQLDSLHKERAEDLRVCEKVRETLRITKEQLISCQQERDTQAAKAVEQEGRVTELQSKLEALQGRYRQLELHAQAESARLELQTKLILSGEEVDPAQVAALTGLGVTAVGAGGITGGGGAVDNNRVASPVKGPTSGGGGGALVGSPVTPLKGSGPVVDTELTPVSKLQDKIAKLQSALQKKDAELLRVEEELHTLRERFSEQAREYKDCMRDYAELEKHHQVARQEHREAMYGLQEQCDSLQDEVGRLQGALDRQSETEARLNAMIAEFCKEDTTGSTNRTDGTKRQLFTHGSSAGGDLHSLAGSEITGAEGVGGCTNPHCLAEKQALQTQLAERVRELTEQRDKHERLYLHKNEECARFAQTITQLEANALALSVSIKEEKDKTEATIERYRSEKRKLAKACEQLHAQLEVKDTELTRARAAMDQLQGAISTFQRIGVS